VGRAPPAGDRTHLPTRADAARDHSRLRRNAHRRRDEARPSARQDERAGSVPATSGANLMQARTAFRLAMLKNGYWPLLNDCKRPIEKDWQKKRPDRAEVLSWDRSPFASTGMKIDGDLAVIDADIRESTLIDALAEALGKRYPELFARGLVRHAGGVKEAWFARTETPFQRICSRKWCRGDPKDPAAITHRVECFGSRKTRQFGVDGPHTRENGVAIRTYSFAGGASPANTPRAFLPVLPKAAFAAACDLFDEIAAAAGLTVVKAEQGNGATGVIYDLTTWCLKASAAFIGLGASP